jgi:DNA-binding response OmpR family regulator
MENSQIYILVIEDDPILKNLLGKALASTHQVLYANDGQMGVEMFQQYSPALVLLDLTLPRMDGFTVLENIRQKNGELGKTVPVIIVSNLGQQSDKDRALLLGANEYIVKAEVDVDDIVKRVAVTLGESE